MLTLANKGASYRWQTTRPTIRTVSAGRNDVGAIIAHRGYRK